MTIALRATQIAEKLISEDILFVADDDSRARVLAAAVTILAPVAEIIFIPASDSLPGDDAPASPANAGQRAAAFRRLRARDRAGASPRLACITSAEATARLYPLPESFSSSPPFLKIGDELNLESFEAAGTELGYIVDDRIDEPGEIAVRGNVVDIFPADRDLPVRIEVIDGRIGSFRIYDPVDQRTMEECAEIEIGRANEPEIGKGGTLLQHLTPGSVLLEVGVNKRRKSFLALVADAAKFGRADLNIVSEKQWTEQLSEWTLVDFNEFEAKDVPRFIEHRSPLASAVKFVEPLLTDGYRLVLFGSERDLRFLRPRVAKRLKRACSPVASWADAKLSAPGSVMTIELAADAGFITDTIVAIAAADLIGSRAGRQDDTGQSVSVLEGLADIRIDDVVVHEDHGIAIIRGIETMPDAAEGGQDGITLEFANNARRLISTYHADKLWRYGAAADAVSLDKLDGSGWSKRRLAIDTAVTETAVVLTELAIEREKLKTTPLEPDATAYEQFSARFPFTETPDQSRAISAVRTDLASEKPMDRLLIGDVGFGKTEVALRAAAIAALAGGQVVIAAPTTVLVKQHMNLFVRRFAESNINVASLSRLSTAAEKARVKAGLADGSIAIVIGTAAVAAKGLKYKNLSLVIVDEEQRFGTADKNKLRSLSDGNVLALTATPIPRTLQAALVGLQQMSIIATPPSRRQPIRTIVDQWDDARVRMALAREKARRGQSFVVVPRIEDMAEISARLKKIMPNASIVQAHGKMPAAELDEAMTEFAAGNGDVLLATNIIEAGLDVPRANTMVVWHADRFGLSQLHQLRGRVGRGSRRGQILLLTDPAQKIASSTLKRLSTLQAFDRLGSGFAISAQDLDLRGAGDLLGDSQSGHMKLIGIDLYQHLLEGALRKARGDTTLEWTPELKIGKVGRLPAEWIPEADLRLQLYLRLSRLEASGEIDSFEAELEDRFVEIPDDAQTLLAVSRIRALAKSLDIERIDAGPAAIALTIRAGHKTRFKNSGLKYADGRFLSHERNDDPGELISRVEALLAELSGEIAG